METNQRQRYEPFVTCGVRNLRFIAARTIFFTANICCVVASAQAATVIADSN